MVFENLFGSANVGDIFAQEGIGKAGQVGQENPGSSGFLNELFSDPNFIRTLGETGAAISGPGSIGEAVGTGASNWVRNRGVQDTASRLRKEREERSTNDQLMDFLFEKGLLGPLEDNTTPDALTIKGDGSISSSMKNVPQQASFGSQQPLESVRRPSPGGDDLPNFSNESGGGEIDFAGLDPEDVSMLLQAEQQFGTLDQRQMKMLLDEKARRAQAVAASQTRADTLKRLGEERLAKSFKEKREAVAKVDAARTLAEGKTALETHKASLKGKAGAKPSDIIAQKKLEIAERGEKRDIAEDELANQDFILDPETDRAQATFQADKENSRVDGEYVFYNAVDAPWFGKNTDIMDAWRIPDGLIFDGQPVTPPKLIEIAKQKGVTVQELITALEGQ